MRGGILLLDKPQKLSSAGAIARIKKSLPEVSKIGHSGTLDPMATGLLICVINGATRLAQFAEAGEKVYSGTIDFGVTSDTNDIWGNVVSCPDAPLPHEDELEAARAEFVGSIVQIPPKVSAVKVEGKRAYRLARSGHDFTLEGRSVSVYKLDFLKYDGQKVWFRLKCSKGFYVRSFARDLGKRLGCGAILSSLRREASMPFCVEDAVPLDEVGSHQVRSWDELFPSAPRVCLSGEQTHFFRNGNVQFLKTLHHELGRMEDTSVAQQRAVCLDKRTGVPLGLLVKPSGENWKIAVNLSV